jgi:hypothetical protein
VWDCKNVFLLFHLEGDVKCSQPYPGSLCSLVKPHPFLVISSYIQELSILNVFGFPGRCWYLLQSGRFDTSGGQELRGALGMNTRLICIFNWPDCWLGFDSIPTWIFLVLCKPCPSSYLNMGGRSWLWPVGYCIELGNACPVQFVTHGW